MQATWANMAKKPSAGPGWPKITWLGGAELGDLGLSNSSGVMVVNTANADYPCAAYFALEDLLGLSY